MAERVLKTLVIGPVRVVKVYEISSGGGWYEWRMECEEHHLSTTGTDHLEAVIDLVAEHLAEAHAPDLSPDPG